MACVHCGIDVGNRMVIMGDNTIHCYTCGRLKADDRCRTGQRIDNYMDKPRYTHLVDAMELLQERKDMYK
jgi:hypothetical protein